MREGPPDAPTAVVLLHGRDQDPSFMAEVAERAVLAHVRRLLPRAAGGSWYPGRFMEPLEANEPWLTWSLDVVDRALDELAAEGHDAEAVALVGFSQGACLLAEHLVRRPGPHAAVALLTGGYFGPDDAERDPAGTLAGTPVLLSTSEVDDWVPPDRVRRTASLLEAMDARVTLHVHDTPEHGVGDTEARQVRELIDMSVHQRPGGA